MERGRSGLDGLLGRCPAMERVRRDVELLGPSDERVHVFGESVRAIGEAARKEIEAFLETRVYLELWVNVQDHWTQDPRALDRLGYR